MHDRINSWCRIWRKIADVGVQVGTAPRQANHLVAGLVQRAIGVSADESGCARQENFSITFAGLRNSGYVSEDAGVQSPISARKPRFYQLGANTRLVRRSRERILWHDYSLVPPRFSRLSCYKSRDFVDSDNDRSQVEHAVARLARQSCQVNEPRCGVGYVKRRRPSCWS